MDQRGKTAFLALVMVQAFHSLEEYAFRLYDVFAPARFLSGLISHDRSTGFIIINAGILVLGLLCYLGPVRNDGASARILIWLWIVIEFMNGIGHLAIAIARWRYFPGAATAPFLLILAVLLARRSLFSRASKLPRIETKNLQNSK